MSESNASPSWAAAPHAITLGDADITLDDLVRAEARPLRMDVSPAARKRLVDSRAMLETLAAGGDAVYGVNTGFGPLCRQKIAAGDLEQLQENLLLSHAVGVGSRTPCRIVRWMMWFKLHGLARGCSGVRNETFDALLALLNADLMPVVPTRGSLGASGDLAPLAHLCLPLIGRGEVRNKGMQFPAAAALKSAGLEPIRLGAKDGLALINGTQFITAYAASIVVRARRLAKLADIAATMSLEALRGSLRPFDARLHDVRPHPGAKTVAANVRAMMKDSEILTSHENCGKVQDPYSLRCVPPVHGACRDALAHATQVTLREINSVTDNPLLFDGEAISGGNFHAEPMALVLDYLTMALTEWASISERRIYLLLGGHDGLPPMLTPNPGLCSGLMITQYTAASLVAECKILSHPASVDSIPTSAGQEDHVSMGATAAVKCWDVLEKVETVLAIELLCAAQGLDFRLPLQAGIGPRAAHAAVRAVVPHADRDREFGRDIAALMQIGVSSNLIERVESAPVKLV